MKNIKTLSIIITAITLSACAGQSTDNTASADDNGKICRFEKTTGTHIGTRICRTPAQAEAEKLAAKQAMATLQRGQTKTTN